MGELKRWYWRLTFASLRQKAALARQDTGKPVWAQFAEILALRLGVGELQPDEYYQYQLYDDRRYSWSEKKRFPGRRLENGLIPFLEEGPWVGLAHDKLTAYAYFRGLGLPIPHTYAIHHASRSFGATPVCRTQEALAAFIRNDIERPFVAKPVTGMWGEDVWAVARYDRERDRLVLANGREAEVEALVRSFAHRSSDGVLLQELLEPHPAIALLCGPRICSVRMVTLMNGAGPRLLATLWKVNTGENMADNYWGPGNMVAPIDMATGRIGRSFTGLGRDLRFVDAHPDTGRELPGAALPDWQAATELCLAATASIPGIPMQAWDIALTSRGPVILEVNVNGGMRLPQLTRQGGLYTDELREFLDAYGFPRRGLLRRLVGA